MTNAAVSRSGARYLQIGDVRGRIRTPRNIALVPSVLFYDMPKHLLYLQQMLRDFELGEHLLLIGNQAGAHSLTAVC